MRRNVLSKPVRLSKKESGGCGRGVRTRGGEGSEKPKIVQVMRPYKQRKVTAVTLLSRSGWQDGRLPLGDIGKDPKYKLRIGTGGKRPLRPVGLLRILWSNQSPLPWMG